MRKVLAVIAVLPVFLALLAGSCGPPENSSTPGPVSSPSATLPSEAMPPLENLTVEQASEIIGLPVPVPEYLPAGYAVASVAIKNISEPLGPSWDIEMTITSANSTGPITLSTVGLAPGMPPPGAETVMIGTSKGLVRTTPDGTSLSWTDMQGREDSLAAGTGVQLAELVKIAQSVTSPPKRAIDITEPEGTPLLVLRGTSQDIVIRLQNNSTKNVDISFALDNTISNIPPGINVSIDKASFTLVPAQHTDVTVKVSVSANASSPAYANVPASSILSTAAPPPLSGAETEQPSYYLSFLVDCHYPAAGYSIQERDGFFRQLRIDPPLTLPQGMVSLQDAQAAANFPVSMLLTAYLPEGTNAPPLGYGIGAQQPPAITAFYSSFSVTLSPEPGVTGPPSDFPGQRDTIRKRTVVISSNRIDWWADDIHRTVISDELPMSELRLIAASMMLVAPYSGSWIGEK